MGGDTMNRQALVVGTFLLFGCQKEVPQTASSGGDVSPSAPIAAALATDPQPTPSDTGTPALPALWQGTGTLAKRDDVPTQCPDWMHVAAEIVERDGQRYLVTSGVVQGVQNPALAKSTAEARARAEMAKWLGVQVIQGSRVIATFSASKKLPVGARLELAVPSGWSPGQPLPN